MSKENGELSSIFKGEYRLTLTFTRTLIFIHAR